MKTTLTYHNAEKVDSFVTKLAQRAWKDISIAEPILDATMGDGSRIQMTLGQEVTAHGSTFTIRKFKTSRLRRPIPSSGHTFAPLSVADISGSQSRTANLPFLLAGQHPVRQHR